MLQKITKRKNLLMAAMLLYFCAFTNEAMGQTWNIGHNSVSGGNYLSTVTATLNGNTLTIKGSGNMADFWCTGTNQYDAGGEAPWYPNRAAIRSVIIENGVQNIGMRTFKDCTNLETITIANTVTKINGQAFLNCSKLHTVTIANGNSTLEFSSYSSSDPCNNNAWNKNVSDWFDGCTSLTTLHLGRNYSGDFISNIRTRLSNLTIGNTVKEIGSNAFANCRGLVTITLQDGLDDLKVYYNGNSFTDCPIQTLHLGRNIDNSLSIMAPTSPFQGKSELSSLTIGSNVKIIIANAFNGCTGLTSLTIPNNVTTIGSSAFKGCTELKSVTIGTGIKTIASSTFFGCSKLTSITIPSTVTLIDENAFANCRSLATVTIQDGLDDLKVYYSGNSFTDCPIQTLHLGRNIDNSLSIMAPTSPFQGKSELSSLIIGSNVKTIIANAFNGCTGLTQITSNPTTPPTIQSNTFTGVGKSLPIKVPCNSLCDYKTKWSSAAFTNYQSIENSCHSSCANSIDNVVANQLQIYPNPAKHELFIKSEIPIEKVEICSLAGTLLLSENNFAEKITVSTLPHGIYLLKVYTDKGVAVSKIVKE